MDFRGFDSSTILDSRGGILRPIGCFPGKFESSNVSRDNVSREKSGVLSYDTSLHDTVLHDTADTRVGLGVCKCLVELYVIACWLYYTCKRSINRIIIVSALYR